MIRLISNHNHLHLQAPEVNNNSEVDTTLPVSQVRKHVSFDLPME